MAFKPLSPARLHELATIVADAKHKAFEKRDANDDGALLPARQVWERYGVTDMTLHRWIRDERRNFPKPVYIGRFRYWRLADLQRWERSRPTERGQQAA